MKKYLFMLTAVALLVFAFAAVAGAKYAGYAKDGSATVDSTGAVVNSTTPGYLSWGGAQSIMASNGTSTQNGITLDQTAHGGYVTTTTKCAVCHSVHRATGIGVITGTAPTSNANGVVNQFLTNGADSCVQCHTAWGATPAALLVEWANPADGTAGPHDTANNPGCATCHQGGIHGTGNSIYWGMNAYLLGGINDDQITAEKNLLLAREGNSDLNSVISATHTNDGTSWFFDGNTVNTTIGGVPATPVNSPMEANIYAAARSILTGYTCSRSGCHVNSVLANITWGQTYQREQLGAGTGFMMTTGHSSAPGINTGYELNPQGGYPAQCGPCHPGNPAGGYRGSGYLNVNSGDPNLSARAYGCDQCHDAVGKATNSTAFPHGNRAIEVYQWADDSTVAGAKSPTTITSSAGNILVYLSNMASKDFTGNLVSLVDPTVTLIPDAVPGSGNTRDPGNITDGVCVKCHIPTDQASAAVYDADELYVSAPMSPHLQWDQTQLEGANINNMNFYTGDFENYDPNPGSGGANLIYLWR